MAVLLTSLAPVSPTAEAAPAMATVVADPDIQKVRVRLNFAVEWYQIELPADESEIVEVIPLPEYRDLNKESILSGLRAWKASSAPAGAELGWLDALMAEWETGEIKNGVIYDLGVKVINRMDAPPMEVVIREASIYGGGEVSLWNMTVDDNASSYALTDSGMTVNAFKDLVMSRSETYDLTLIPQYANQQLLNKHQLTIVLRRPSRCMMTVTYSGDLEGSDFGDVAYYNDFLKPGSRYAEQGGVARATGSAADPAAMATLNQLMEMTGAYTGDEQEIYAEEEASAAEGFEVDPFGEQPTLSEVASAVVTPPPAEPEQSDDDSQEAERRAAMDEFADWVGGKDEVPRAELETFGLTMVARKRVNTPDKRHGMELLLNGLTLEAASRARTLHSEAVFSSEVAMPLSRIEFSPPGRRAGSGDRVRFTWKEGGDGFGKMSLLAVPGKPDAISGVISGQLFSHTFRQPDGRDSMVNFEAKFVAAETALDCEFP